MKDWGILWSVNLWMVVVIVYFMMINIMGIILMIKEKGSWVCFDVSRF